MLVEALLKVNGVQFKEPIQMLRRLNTIRSKTSPIHRADHDLVKIYRHLGIKWPTQDSSTAGKTCLQYFLSAVESLRQRLSL